MANTKWIQTQVFMNDLFGDVDDKDSEYIFYDTLGKISIELVNYRIRNGLSQADLARMLGVTQAMVSKYESGEYNISLKAVIELLTKIGIHFDLNIGKAETEDELPEIAEVYTRSESIDPSAMLEKFGEFANVA